MNIILLLISIVIAMYEKDGQPLEEILMNIIRVKFLRPSVRKYETENYYESELENADHSNSNEKGGKKRV